MVFEDEEKSTSLSFEKEALRKLLIESFPGQCILKNYETLKRLTNREQDILSKAIIDHELRNDINKKITSRRFETLARSIEELFPTETKEVYFSHTFRKTKESWKRLGGGKLFRRYYNTRRELNKRGLLRKRKAFILTTASTSSDVHDEEDDDDKTALNELWLMNSIEPWTEVIEKWDRTFKRRSPLTNRISVLDYINRFPALKQEMGYNLLERDFQRTYPGKEMQLFTEFDSFSEKIISYGREINTQSVKEYVKIFDEDLSKDARNTYVLKLIPLLLKTNIVKKNGPGTWKPSIIEASESFIMHVKVPGDIKPALEKKANKSATYGLTLPPTPIIVGESLSSISSSHVAVGNLMYEVATPLKAVDTAFKMIHALNQTYPPEAEQPWLVIQKSMFKINTYYDKPSPSTQNLIKLLSV